MTELRKALLSPGCRVTSVDRTLSVFLLVLGSRGRCRPHDHGRCYRLSRLRQKAFHEQFRGTFQMAPDQLFRPQSIDSLQGVQDLKMFLVKIKDPLGQLRRHRPESPEVVLKRYDETSEHRVAAGFHNESVKGQAGVCQGCVIRFPVRLPARSAVPQLRPDEPGPRDRRPDGRRILRERPAPGTFPRSRATRCGRQNFPSAAGSQPTLLFPGAESLPAEECDSDSRF